MKNNSILLYWGSRRLNIFERSLLIFNFCKQLHLIYFKDSIWQNSDSKTIEYEENRGLLIILDQIKKEIKKHYKLKVVPDDFIEDTFSFSIISNEYITIRIANGSNKGNYISIEKRFKSKYELDELMVKLIFIEAIKYFSPEWGVITNMNFTFDIANQTTDEYWFGWMTYFSQNVHIPKIPKEYEEEIISDFGKLIITTPEIFDIENDSHLEKAGNLIKLFRKKKIFRNRSSFFSKIKSSLLILLKQKDSVQVFN